MRINIIGTSGSGKTTYGRQLAEILVIPFFEMDAIFWGPDWSEPGDEIFFSRLSAALSGDNWVLDGNYSRTLPIKWNQVDVVVWLDFSFPRTLYQAFCRAFSRLFSREELWPNTGNRESLRKLFSRDSILLWTIRTYHRTRKKIKSYSNVEEFKHIKFHRLRSPAQARSFLAAARTDPDSIKLSYPQTRMNL